MRKSGASAIPIALAGSKPPKRRVARAAEGPAGALDLGLTVQDLRAFPILNSLSDAEIAHILSRLSLVRAFDGRIGARRDIQEVPFSFILSGAYRSVALTPDGTGVTLRTLGPGDHFGEMGFLSKCAPANWALIADVPGDILYLTYADLGEILDRIPALRTELLQSVAAQAVDWAQRIFELATLPPRLRLLAELVRLADARGLPGPRAVLTEAPTHDALGSQIGITREAVSCNMRVLREDGLITNGRREITLLDLPRLRSLISEHGARLVRKSGTN